MDSVVWFVIMIALFILEAATIQLVSIWFAFGAMAGFLTSFFIDNWIVQCAVAIVVSVAVLLMVRPMVKKRLTPKVVKTNADRVVGETGLVTERVDNLRETGRVNALGLYWMARSSGDTPIEEGARVKVLALEGVKVIVEKINS